MASTSVQVSLILLVSWSHTAQGTCTFTDIDSNIYGCFSIAGYINEYILPVFGSTSDANNFCTSDLTTLKNCVTTHIQNCSPNTTVTQFFGDGTDITGAYDYLCAQFQSNSNVEPFSCAVAADPANIKGNLSDFDTAVDALSNPTLTEVCSLAETMLAAFVYELATACYGSSTSMTIWTNYLSLTTSACNGADTASASALLLLLSAYLPFMFRF